MLGQPAMRRAIVPHPVQDKTTDEIRELATTAVQRLLSILAADAG